MRLLPNNEKLLLCLAALGLVFPASLTRAAEDNSAGTIALETSADRLLFDRSSGRLVSLRGKSAPDVGPLLTPVHLMRECSGILTTSSPGAVSSVG